MQRTEFKTGMNVALVDATASGWPELAGKVGVVQESQLNGQRIRVFLDGYGWLDFEADKLVPAPSASVRLD